LRALNFPEIFVRWIMVCISTVTYSILINGRLTDPFEAKKGLRQGDPLSPFFICYGYGISEQVIEDPKGG